ncbi:hypothetical protein BCV69DRAFT_280070 [Microstroma glucosiphilum]|uniref:THIF-type NAD/FAD binding fold domain-containing protein n=1 Tax=Pseudomicrostroma glucosiphilum TaxID=1684307 RepID=A0A316UFZ9_9BASI|nr:hypothetical protein BCV69DRAFT_280070 [Pseudomicrostroma glucosiphilum]PWN24176.1 hypothetical protein BCV69DRAFT_280070 [Pseudomicrostroma glucosiphilum]
MPTPSSSAPSSSSQSWTSSLLTLPTTQQGRLIITSLASITLTAASIFSYQAAVRLQRRRDLAKRVDKATHRDRDAEKRLLARQTAEDLDDGKEPVDGGTPRYLEHLTHLAPGKPGSSVAGFRGSRLRRQASYQSNTSSHSIKPTLQPLPSTYDDSLIREQLSRNYSFLGDEAMAKLREAFVVVVGLGGVGSHVALSLIRSGIGHVRLIDFDQVSLSSLNRHAVASLEDVGRPKVTICQEHFAGISPWVHIQAWVDVFNESDAPRLFSPFRLPASSSSGGAAREIPVTYVIDCIDNLSTKVGLLAYCHENNIKVFSSMGAGAKCDPTRICIGDLSATEEDPLAKSVRRRLRERGIPKIDEAKQAGPSSETNDGKQGGKGAVKQQKTKANKKAGASQAKDKTLQRESSLEKEKTKAPVKPSEIPFRPAPTPSPISIPDRRSFSGKRLSRASSASSFGSGGGAFYTPEGTPKDEEEMYTLDDESPDDRAGEGQSGIAPSLKLPEVAVDDSSEMDQTVVPLQSPTPEPSRPAAFSSPLLLRPANQHRASSGLQSLSASPMEENGRGQSEGFPGLTPQEGAEEEARVPAVEEGETDGEGKGIAANATSLAVPDKASEEAIQAEHEERQEEQAKRAKELEKAQDHEANRVLQATVVPDSPLAPSNPRYLIPCIFSTEKPPAQLLPLPEAEFQKEGGVEMLRALEDGNEWRVRVLPVLGPLPAIFGLSIASWIICDIAGGKGVGGVELMQPMESRVRKKAFDKIQRELENLERLYPSSSASTSGPSNKPQPPSSVTSSSAISNRPGRGSPFLLDDVLYLVHEVFHSRSIVPPHATISSHNGLLVRWDSTLPLGYGNVALLTKEEGKRHANEVLKRGRSPVEVWGEEAADVWRRRMEEERWYARLR